MHFEVLLGCYQAKRFEFGIKVDELRSSEGHVAGKRRRVVKQALACRAEIWVFFVNQGFGARPGIEEVFFAVFVLARR